MSITGVYNWCVVSITGVSVTGLHSRCLRWLSITGVCITGV